MKQFIVQDNEAGQRLDKLLLKILNKAPKSFIYKMLRKKNIVLNGKKADGSERLNVNDEIKLFLSDSTIAQFQDSIDSTIVEYDLDIVYEDSHLLIINKPFGVLSQKGKKEDVSLVEHVTSYLLSTNQLTKQQLISFRPGLCNRLDRNTSGLIIAGKSLLGLQEMARLLKEGSVDKYYLCIVKGKVESKHRIEGYLHKDTKKNVVTILSEKRDNSAFICTEYEPFYISEPKEIQGVKEYYTLLQVKLITGRSHQIRAHLASIGHPILGDFKYGEQKTNHYFKINYGLSHQLLHSYRIVYPTIIGKLSYLSGREFKAQLPDIFNKIKDDLYPMREILL
ncbi:MAG: RluA family pseudouridine synthase [Clostridiales bacterium]|nr:RluA family pseudouridine synthase [Clostridiales bacterium]